VRRPDLEAACPALNLLLKLTSIAIRKSKIAAVLYISHPLSWLLVLGEKKGTKRK
jgi:hypothetical protein